MHTVAVGFLFFQEKNLQEKLKNKSFSLQRRVDKLQLARVVAEVNIMEDR